MFPITLVFFISPLFAAHDFEAGLFTFMLQVNMPVKSKAIFGPFRYLRFFIIF